MAEDHPRANASDAGRSAARAARRVLVVLPEVPLPEGGPAARCSIALLDGLRAHGLDVRAIAARRWDAPPDRPPEHLDVEIVPVERPSRREVARDFVVRPLGLLSRGAFGARVRELAREVDVVHLEQVHTGWCDLGVATPSLVHLHYLVSADQDLVWWPPGRVETLWGFHRGEMAALRRHRLVVASSPLVAAALRRRAPEREVHLAPLSLDPAAYVPAALDGPPVVGFLGRAAWPPSASALRRLVDRVWPLVHGEVPEARLAIAGRGTQALHVGGAEGVRVLGEVPSAPGFLVGLSCLLYPLERGSGVKIKVLESIASGLPVVTTVRGAEGIGPGDGVVIARDDDELAAAVVTLLRDDADRRRRGAAARATFLAHHAPLPATAPLLPLYERLVAGGVG